MSILITGMEMPKSCGNCYMFSFLSDSCRITNHVTEEMNDKMFDRRFDDCPLVPVPPHGRLIDADVLLEWANADLRFGDPDFHAGLWHAVSAIKDAPTIIPAEEAPAEDINVPGTYDLLYEEGGPDTR